MAAILDPINPHVSSPLSSSRSAPAPPSAASAAPAAPATDPSHAYPSPPVEAQDESASEDESRRGRSKFSYLPEVVAVGDSSCSADSRKGRVPSRPPRALSTIRKHRRGASVSANKTCEVTHKLTAAEMQDLASSPDSLPIAPAPDRLSTDQEMELTQSAGQRDHLRQWSQNRSSNARKQLERLQTNGLPVESLSGLLHSSVWQVRDGAARRPCSSRTVSTPPTTRVQKYYVETASQPTSPGVYSHNSLLKPSPLNLTREASNSLFRARTPSPAIKTGPAVTNSQQQAQQHQKNSAAHLSQGYIGPSPPSPIPTIIPLPPMSLPTHLQLELAGQRPSPLYIHQSHLNDIPYESYAIKLERLKNLLLLPSYLERTLYFGALACLDAWLHTFTILPIRFFVALGVLLKWWRYLVAKEVQWLVEYVRDGLVRLWKRGRTNQPRTRNSVPDTGRSRSPSRASESNTDSGGAISASAHRDHLPRARLEPHREGQEHMIRLPSSSGQQQGPLSSGTFRHRRTKSVPSALSTFHKADLLQGAVIICSSFALMTLDASRMYHFIRAQSAIKLYVIYNILEVGDRLLSAIGQDILECLFSNETLSRNSSGRSKILLPLGMFGLALIYNCLHSIALYYQVITLNVAVNSYSNALLTLLLSNQFVEIKSTVFKRFDKDNLFQLTCADIVERFHLWIMLIIIGMRNVVEVGAFSVPGAGLDSTHDDGNAAVPLHPPSILPHSFTVLPSWLRSGEALSPFLIVVGSEMLVDSIKHAVVTKFNNIKPTFYGRTLDILCKDYYTNAFVTPSLTRRLGLAVIPLSCLFIRASIQTYHMFLSTHVPMPPPPSTQTSLTEESTVPSSPAMMAALSRFDALIRDSLGRATYGYPYGSPWKSRPWYAWTSDDFIAALTMVVVFFIVFLVLLILKLLLGMLLLQYSRNRYANMKQKENLIALGKLERESYDTAGKRVGGRGEVEVSNDAARWIHADKTEGLKGGKVLGAKKDDKGKKDHGGDYMGVARYDMVAKRIW